MKENDFLGQGDIAGLIVIFLQNTVGGMKTSPSFSFIGGKPNLSKCICSYIQGIGMMANDSCYK